jgi:RNA polymerase sigma-70 factor (ECF subfamily)
MTPDRIHDQHRLVEALLRHRGRLLGYLRSKVATPELAEDLLQESLLKALRAAPDLREEEKLLPWFLRILDNAVIDLYRRRATERKHLSFAGELPDQAAESDDVAALCACFKELLPTLKPEYAALIERMDLGQASPDEVAGEFGITKNNLKVRHHRARQALRTRLEETCRACAVHGCLDCTCGQQPPK